MLVSYFTDLWLLLNRMSESSEIVNKFFDTNKARQGLTLQSGDSFCSVDDTVEIDPRPFSVSDETGNKDISGGSTSSQKLKSTTIAPVVDKSRKGSVDQQILELVTAINLHPDFFTTSSCSGRAILIAHSPPSSVSFN